jgi:hypothetical protein
MIGPNIPLVNFIGFDVKPASCLSLRSNHPIGRRAAREELYPSNPPEWDGELVGRCKL